MSACHIIGLGSKFFLTLSVSQVACEIKLSFGLVVKNHPRTSLGEERLKAFLLMAKEKEVLLEREDYPLMGWQRAAADCGLLL